MDVTELIDRYCQVWNEPDPQTRANLLASVWANGANYTDPTVHAANEAELLTHIASVQARRPGARVLRTSVVDAHHCMARYKWHVVQTDGTALPEGVDIAFLSQDGTRIERIIGFFGPMKRNAA
ncbi:MAG: nuclear transport factor 2 family protein [Alphaproteobacteria bacterium]|nr:nuclear transport factor 2 family protein [Alphaproteobacteria bacterium]